MNKMKTCQKCGSKKIVVEQYMGIPCIVCTSCGYDEASKYDLFPEEKTSQKAKGQFSPYKTGGAKRTTK